MIWIIRTSATGKKSIFMWYFIKPISLHKGPKKEEDFYVKSAKKEASISVQLFATYIL